MVYCCYFACYNDIFKLKLGCCSIVCCGGKLHVIYINYVICIALIKKNQEFCFSLNHECLYYSRRDVKYAHRLFNKTNAYHTEPCQFIIDFILIIYSGEEILQDYAILRNLSPSFVRGLA
jgi:hypothetical protein